MEPLSGKASEACKPEYSVFSSEEDEPIVAYVREHLKDIREGWEHLQIAGGDGVHLTITLRRETDQPVRTDRLKKTQHCLRTQGTLAAEARKHRTE
jgi:hypothetical protein